MSVDTAQRQLSQACAALDRALKSGAGARAETWLQACPALATDHDLAVELIYSEFVAREALGTPPAPEEYYSRFPHYRERLRRLFGVDELLRRDGAASSIAGEGASTHTEAAPNTAPAPRRVGTYELLEKLGGGGMGVVYRARQARPARDVAIKLLRAGADAGAVELARFQREAQAAARLQHPNIATIYEVGDDDGQPYLVMEYVSGGDLRTALAGRPLPPMIAAEMMAVLARAIQFAHTQGVVHRDLKPANVLVGGDSISLTTIKITDFGLAALMEPGAADGLTRTGQLLGTTAYVAPEQVNGMSASPLVDVYALGAVLYESLTGRPPFVADCDATTLHMVLHEDPVPPRKLNPGVPRDLDTIALKCLEKEPRRRYASAAELADDLERFQRGEAIVARPVGITETGWKWAKRRPAAAALFVVSLASLIAVVALTANYTTKLTKSLAEEDAQRTRAVTALAAETRRQTQARAALDRLTERLLADGWKTARPTAEQIASLEQALKSYQELAADAGADEESRAGAARAFNHASRLQVALGRRDEAIESLNRSVESYVTLARDFPSREDFRNGWAGALHDRGRALFLARRFEESVADYQNSIVVQRQLPDVGGPARQARLAATMSNLVSSFEFLKSPQREVVEREAFAIWERLHGTDPDEPSYRGGLASLVQNRGHHAMRRGALQAAEGDLRSAKELRTPNGKLIAVGDARAQQAQCHEFLGQLAAGRKATAESVAEYRTAIEIWIALATQQPNVGAYYERLGDVFSSLNPFIGPHLPAAELEGLYRRYRPLIDQRVVTEPEPAMLLQAGAIACNHGHLLKLIGRRDDAMTSYAAADDWLDKLLTQKPDHVKGRQFRANANFGAASVCNDLSRHADAARHWHLAAEFEAGPKKVNYQIDHAASLGRSGDARGAIAAAEAIAMPAPAHGFARATVYAIAHNTAVEASTKRRAEELALEWLGHARRAGQLRDPSVQKILRQSADWAPLRDRHSVENLLTGKAD